MKTLGKWMIVVVGALSLWAGLSYVAIHTLRSTYEMTVPVARLETELRSNYPGIGLFELPPWMEISSSSSMAPESTDDATSFLESLKGDEHIYISGSYLAETRIYISQSREGAYKLFQETLTVPPARNWTYAQTIAQESPDVQGSPETVVVEYDNGGIVSVFAIIGSCLLVVAIGMVWEFAHNASRRRAKQKADETTP